MIHALTALSRSRASRLLTAETATVLTYENLRRQRTLSLCESCTHRLTPTEAPLHRASAIGVARLSKIPRYSNLDSRVAYCNRPFGSVVPYPYP